MCGLPRRNYAYANGTGTNRNVGREIMEIGFIQPMLGIVICCECNREWGDYNPKNNEWEIIYNDYENWPLGDINYEYFCQYCDESFIGNIR